MNGYVAGGWGATAGVLALYSWRMLHRGRLLARKLDRRVLPERGKNGGDG